MGEGTPPFEAKRRNLFQRAWWALLGLSGMLLGYPVARFVAYVPPRKPRRVEVNRPMPAAGFLVEAEFVLFGENNRYWAVSRTCTHLGCTLRYKDGEGILECPCHQSRFSRSGQRLAGPARRDLPRYPARAREDGQGFVVVL